MFDIIIHNNKSYNIYRLMNHITKDLITDRDSVSIDYIINYICSNSTAKLDDFDCKVNQNHFENDIKSYGWTYKEFEYELLQRLTDDFITIRLSDPIKISSSISLDKKKQETESMTKEDLFKVFATMFPAFVPFVTSYRKIGPRVLAINFDYGSAKASRVFMYINDDNWHFGTKLYRKNPRIEKNERMEKND